MIDDLTRSVVKAHQWLKDNPKEQGKPTQEQIDADIAYAEQNWIGEAKGNNARVLRLASALRDAQAKLKETEGRATDMILDLSKKWVHASAACRRLFRWLDLTKAEVARLRRIVEADTATLSNARKCISVGGTIYQRPKSPNCAGPTFYTPFEREVLAAIDMTLKLREGE